MRFDVLTLFPEMFSGIDASIVKMAAEELLVDHNFRDFSRTNTEGRTITPMAGAQANHQFRRSGLLRSIEGHGRRTSLFTPSGKLFTQKARILHKNA